MISDKAVKSSILLAKRLFLRHCHMYGEMIHAAFGGKTFIDGIAEIVLCRTGKFNFTPKLPSEAQDMESLGSIMGILMNALKDMDEKGT